MRAYSEDLRKKIVATTERGTSTAQVARLFDVSLSSVKRYTRIARQGGSLTPKKGTGLFLRGGDTGDGVEGAK